MFIYPDALLADFSMEIGDIKNRQMQDGVGLASC